MSDDRRRLEHDDEYDRADDERGEGSNGYGTESDEYGAGYDDEYDGTESDEYGAGYDDEYDGDEYDGDEDDGTWLDEGLITLTILTGAVLFLIPEPATSGLGILLLAIGVTAWLIDWAI